jgi:hypothetical protein
MSPVQALRDLYVRGGGRREFFEMLSTYTNWRTDMQAARAAEHTKLGYTTVVRFLKELSEIGVGDFKYGRRGAKTRIVWKFSPRSVGDVARGRTSQLEGYDEAADPPPYAAPQQLSEGGKASGEPDWASWVAEAKSYLAAKMNIPPEEITITIARKF